VALSSSSDAEIVERILNFDARIRYCAVVDPDGQVLEGGMREGLSPLEPANQTKVILTRSTLIMKMFEASEEFFGAVKAAMVLHESIVLAVLALSQSKFLVISCDPSFFVNLTQLSEVAKSGSP
jgi:hypothetical protein